MFLDLSKESKVYFLRLIKLKIQKKAYIMKQRLLYKLNRTQWEEYGESYLEDNTLKINNSFMIELEYKISKDLTEHQQHNQFCTYDR